MRFSVASILAFASAVLAQTADFDPITKPGKEETIPAGTTYEVTWQPSTKYDGTVSITLLGGGSPSTLEDVEVVGSKYQKIHI